MDPSLSDFDKAASSWAFGPDIYWMDFGAGYDIQHQSPFSKYRVQMLNWKQPYQNPTKRDPFWAESSL